MKNLPTLALLILCMSGMAAQNPSFSSFDLNFFSTNGNKITIINVPYSTNGAIVPAGGFLAYTGSTNAAGSPATYATFNGGGLTNGAGNPFVDRTVTNGLQGALGFSPQPTNNTLTQLAASNGSGLTNLHSVPTFYSNPEAESFVRSNSISSHTEINDVVDYETELKDSGFWTNLTDAVVFNPRFKALGKTFLGRSYSTNGLSQNNFGAYGFTNTITIPVPDMTNGTMVVVWKYPPSRIAVVSLIPEVIGGVCDTGKSNGFTFHTYPTSWQTWNTMTNGVLSDTFDGQYMLRVNVSTAGGGYYDDISQHSLERKCDVLTWNTNGNASWARNNMRSHIGLNSPVAVKAEPGTTNANTLFFGGDLKANTGRTNFTGYISSIQWFSGVEYSSNLVCAALRAAAYLDVDNDAQIVIDGDSRMVPNSTNSPDWFLLTSGKFQPDTVCYNYSSSGVPAQGVLTGDIAAYFDIFRGHKKVKHVDYFEAYGVDDPGEYNSSGAQTWGYITNLTGVIAPPANFRIHVGTVGLLYPTNQTFAAYWTNNGLMALVGGNQQAAVAFMNSNIVVLNNTILSNRNLFFDVFDTASIMTQSNLNPVLNYTTDGCHLDGALGRVLNQQIGLAMSGFPIVPPGTTAAGVTYAQPTLQSLLANVACDFHQDGNQSDNAMIIWFCATNSTAIPVNTDILSVTFGSPHQHPIIFCQAVGATNASNGLGLSVYALALTQISVDPNQVSSTGFTIKSGPTVPAGNTTNQIFIFRAR